MTTTLTEPKKKAESDLQKLEAQAKAAASKDRTDKVDEAIRALRLQREVSHEELYRTVTI